MIIPTPNLIISIFVYTLFSLCTAALAANFYALGYESYSKGDYQSAKKYFLAAIEKNSKSWAAHYQLANTYVQLKDGVNAKREYAKCLTYELPFNIKQNCTQAIIYIKTNPQLKDQQTLFQQAKLYSKSNQEADMKRLEQAQKEANQQRGQIMVDAEQEVVKIKEETKTKLEDIANRAVLREVLPDGSDRPVVDLETEKQIKLNADREINRVMSDAKRRAQEIIVP